MTSRGIADKTIERHAHLVEILKAESEKGTYLTQKSLAAISGMSQSTVSRFINVEPWRVSFRTGLYGRIEHTGKMPDLQTFTRAPDGELWTIQRLTKGLLDLQPPKRGVVTAGFRQGNPNLTLSKAVKAYKDKLQGSLSDEELAVTHFLSGNELEQIIDGVEEFAIELLRLCQTTREQTNYGKNDWWLPYVDV